jgi:hypothetical protein
MLGLVFIADIAQRTAGEPLASARRAGVAQLAALSAALLLMPLNGALLGLHAEAFASSARAELAHLAQRMRDGETLRPALFRKQSIHKRLYTAARAGYLELPRGEYALDPWNNPYWIAFSRQAGDSGKLLLYSFGANHRRDSDVDAFVKSPFALEGDDLGLLIDVSAPTRAGR